ncbi:MAG: HEAT repeat domain-containing protein [Archaeoglobaceae archaeon]|nr:HEAT repeat domain-containing protein [Archaeoglobaceae archaeon]MCX8151751.1 HEAT repeat domain-containing protein [Archaeoglobaceae archaeon]MDW8014279.1 HEAT repeat domain-containing protein [Archaeoglobaceae archaeon]
MFSEILAKKFLENLECKIKLKVHGREFLYFAKKLSSISRKIEYEFVGENDKAIEIDDFKIFFHFQPRGLEFQVFLSVLKICCIFKKLESRECKVFLYINECPACAVVVESVAKACIKSGSELHIFRDFGTVPRTIFCDLEILGILSEREAEKWIFVASEEIYEEYIIEKLREGDLDEVLDFVKKKKLGRVLANLTSHKEFFVRLGAMAALEALSNDEEVVRDAKDVLLELLKCSDEKVKEDLVMMLGIIGDKEDICYLREIAKVGGSVGEAAEEALEKIMRKWKY